MKYPLLRSAALLLVSLLFAAPCRADTATKHLWPHEASDLAPDPAVHYGVLPNGVRYAVMPNAEPPGRASLRLHVRAGSLMERDDEQGIAHFLEHMAFNGSTHHAPGTMVEYFQRIGMGFGNDTNAHTSFYETVYLMEAPNVGDHMLDDTMQMLRDYAGGLLLLQEEVDRERGVILAEMRDRDTVRYRLWKDGFKFALPESILPNRFPIGLEECVKAFNAEHIRSFYSRWYTADRFLVVVVGDMDAQRGVALVEKFFSDLPVNGNPLPEPDLGRIDLERGTVFHVYSEAEAPDVTVEIAMLREQAEIVDTKAERVKDMTLHLANAIVDRRLSLLAKDKDAPFGGGSSYNYRWLDFLENSGIELTCRTETWAEALASAEQQLRRALEFGFTQAELDEARASFLNDYENAKRSSDSRKSAQLAGEIYSSYAKGYTYLSPLQSYELAAEELPKITKDDLLSAFRKAWDAGNRLITVSGKLPEGVTKDQARAAYEASQAVEVLPPEEGGAKQFAYREFGDSGQIAQRVDVDDLGIIQLRLSNNVHVNLKPTDYEKNVIRLLLRFGGGSLEVPADKPGLKMFAMMTFDAAGLEAHSVDDLKSIFAGKSVSTSFAITADSFVLSGASTARDMQDQLDLMMARIIAPGYRQEAMREVENNIHSLYTRLEHTPEGLLQNEVDRFLHGDSPLFGFPERKQLEARSLDELREWLSGPLTRGRMELSIVGDFNTEELIPMLLNTFGTLPVRDAVKPDYADRRVLPVTEPQVKTFTYETSIPKGVALLYWHTEDIWDIGRTRRLSVLADILSDRLRLKIREALGEAYSPYAYSGGSDTFKGEGNITCFSSVDPKVVPQVAALIREIAADMAAKGVSEDELERAIKPTLEQIKEVRRNNAYWLNSVMFHSQEYPVRLDWSRNMVDDFRSISVEDINSLARQYLKPERAIEVRVLPVTPATNDDESTKLNISSTPMDRSVLKGGDSNDGHPVFALERAAMQRWCSGDPDGFLELSAPDVVYFDPFQKTRLDGIDALRALYDSFRGQISADWYEFIDAKVQTIGEEGAVLTFQFRSRSGDVEYFWNCTEVYRKDAGDWRIIQTHWSLPKLDTPAQ